MGTLILIPVVLLACITSTKAQAGTAFCATSSINGTVPDAPVIDFDQTRTAGNGFSLTTDTYTVPANGYYWFHFSVALSNYLPTDVRLVGLPGRTPLIERLASNVEMTSRSELAYLTEGRLITLNSAFELINHNAFGQVSFSGFPLDKTMSPVIGFNLGLNVSKMSSGIIPFSLINEDTHWGWDNNTNQYMVPENGTYVITLQAGDYPGYTGSGETVLRVTGQRQVRVFHSSSLVDSNDLNSITIIFDLIENDTIEAFVTESPVYSNFYYPTSMMGFLYQPISQPIVAWCVSTNFSQSGPDNLTFSVVHTNVGEGWNETENVIVIPVSGVYYVTMSGAQSSSGLELNLELLRNGELVASLYSADGSSGTVYYRTRSRSITINLVQDDELRVFLPSGSSTNGQTDIVTSFSGFRISE